MPTQLSTWNITMQRPGNILLQASHHIMQLETNKLATKSQWTGPLIDIKEVCFGVIHPITKQTVTQYWKLHHDPALKDLWVPAMSKELRRLVQGKPGITKATTTIFFLYHDEIQKIPKTEKSPMLASSSTIGRKRKIPTASASPLVGASLTTPTSSPCAPPT
jgi:hypothetical protein